MDCVRATANPQVQQTALLLIADLARVAPELILHSIMPIFTFMGSSVLRQDDEYSAYVINRVKITSTMIKGIHTDYDLLDNQ